ncbi:ComEA family DNA-binding protein [candidate division KSB1 bacterium]|nr:ComEA family DNA-binding protein [candidate division KSB1 bacterium]
MMQPDQVTFGSGFQFSHFRIGYAGQYHQELGLTHQFAVSLSRVNTKSKSIIKTNVPTATTISSTENIIININTATEAELQQLDGVGPTLARRIVVYRHVNGPFRSLEDFDNVKGVGKKLIERNKNRIVFE